MKHLDGVETFCSRKLYHFARMGLCNIYYSKERNSGKSNEWYKSITTYEKEGEILFFLDENLQEIRTKCIPFDVRFEGEKWL